jgi:hypothetical protein
MAVFFKQTRPYLPSKDEDAMSPGMKRSAAIAASLAWISPAAADGAPSDMQETENARDVKSEIPILAYSYTAYGAPARTLGAQAYGLGLAASGQKAIVGGGGTVWGSPVDRLTLIGDGSRDIFGNFAPSAAVLVRLLGAPGSGFSLGALGKYKVEGFAVGPNNEIESEIETGLLLSYVRAGWHFHANAIGGMGLGDDGEIDAEGRLRLGRDLGSLFRVGVDGQARVRLAGSSRLPGGRTWDFAGGPQVLLGSDRFFGALTAGPATMGVWSNVGWTSIVSVGGATL